ncbi:flagellar biosynthesis protein FlhF [Pusillimonas noertemannii]|uniref:flagellar biosynthesis protein FlhF n=1 Tax=Pusillimonas noertemannii TaxID=305977 RepID=UPI0002D26E19|nr:flagellar biosynthesis protein FlhF [Pusillimonas noertemannii]
MNVSRFFGSTNREAMRQVRMALGPDALIVSNRRVNGGVEIMATDQTAATPASVQAIDAGPEPAAASAGRPAAMLRPAPAPPAPARPAAGVSPADVMQAIGSMQGMLEHGFDELLWGAQLRKAPQAVSLFQKLLAMGFSTALLRAMLKRLPEALPPRAALQWCREELVSHLPVLRDEDALWAPGAVLALVGPTGVGKTTTIAKLAARCLRNFGPGGLVLITTDTYRIGAHEQLRTYGRMMGVAVHVAQDRVELARLMDAADPGARILIDNVGVSQRDRYVGEQAAMLAGLSRPVQRLLVLNSASQGDTLDEVARACTSDGGQRPVGCIVTKLDESPRPGPALDIAIRYQLPIHYASTGQKVPEDLVRLDAEAWVDQALSPVQPASTLFSPSAADLAALMAAPSETPWARQPAAHGSLLPGLLALAGTGAARLDEESWRAACVQLDSSEVYSGACRLWRNAVGGKSHDASWRPLAAACNELAAFGQQRMLAVHDSFGVLPGPSRGKLHATVLMGGGGRALASTWQQWPVGSGWQASDGTSGPQAAPETERLRRQIYALQRQAGARTVVHAFDFPAQGLLRELGERSIQWLTHCAGSVRLQAQSCATTAAAHAKTLDYRCMDSVLSRLDLATLQGVPLGSVALWLAEGPVELARRGSPPLALRHVAVRLIDRRDGRTIKSLHGLSNVSHGQAELETLAAWLLVRMEAREAARHLPSAWSALEPSAGCRGSGECAAVAVQVALAAWQALQEGGPLLDALAGLAGTSGRRNGASLTAATASAALIRLFAAKDLMEPRA